MREIGAIALSFILGQRRVGRARQGLSEISGEHLGMEVLANALRQLAGELLQVQAMFQQFERFLDGPAGVIEIGEGGGSPIGLLRIMRRETSTDWHS